MKAKEEIQKEDAEDTVAVHFWGVKDWAIIE